MSLLPEDDVVELHGLRFQLAGVSEQGPRSENQDAYDLEHFRRSGWVAVADGMGGERGGRVAADTALAALADADPIRSLDDARRAVHGADAAVARAAQRNPEQNQGMGCALGLLALTPDAADGPTWLAAHVGDVRIISRSPDGAVRLETRDHTPAFARWEAGEIGMDEIVDSAGANRLQRAVGRGGTADVTWLPARAGWSWLIISDGVYKAMRLEELGRIMAMRSPQAACAAVRDKVEERGPDDNYTALLVRALDGGAGAHAEAETSRPIMMPSSGRGSAPSGRGWSAIAAALALLALAVAAFSLWSARGSAERAVERAEMDRLRATVDSLRVQVRELNDPFGLATPGDTARGILPPPDTTR